MTTLLITIPLFAVLACGYFSHRIRLIGSAGRAGLNKFVYYFALPVLTFSLMAQADLEGKFNWFFVIAYLGVSLVLFVVAYAIARSVFRLNFDLSVVFSTASLYGNTGYMGLPFVIVALGQAASVPIIVCTTLDLVFMLPLASVLLERAKVTSEQSMEGVYKQTLLSVVKNPLIISVALGTLFSLSNLTMPEVVDRFVIFLGSAAAPCALFALGSSLDEDRAEIFQSEIYAISFIKLAIHPLLIWLVMFHIVPVDPDWAKSAIIAAAMPVAVTAYILAQQYETYVARTSASILFSTVLSIASLSIILTQIG